MIDRSKTLLSGRTLLIGLLLGLGVGGVLGCSSSSIETTDAPSPLAGDRAEVSPVETDALSNPSDSSTKKTDDMAFESDPIETTDLVTLTLNLENAQGKPYGEVRDRIIASGWQPHTFGTTTGPESDFQDSLVQDMERLGFMEVKACSGTGQGFCRFEFVYEERTADNGPILVVTTTAASPGHENYPMPNFWSFGQENISDLTYRDRAFDQGLFTQLREQEAFCLGVGQCNPVQYMLTDALLIASTGGFGTAKVSFIPDIPVSREEAIAYAQILDVDSVIDFDTAELNKDLNIENYYEVGLPAETAEELGSVTTVRLQLTPDGRVSDIAFSIIVL